SGEGASERRDPAPPGQPSAAAALGVMNSACPSESVAKHTSPTGSELSSASATYRPASTSRPTTPRSRPDSARTGTNTSAKRPSPGVSVHADSSPDAGGASGNVTTAPIDRRGFAPLDMREAASRSSHG